MMRIRYALVFREEGLDLDGLKHTLSEYGEIFDVVTVMAWEDCPAKIIYIDCPFGKALRLKLDFNCVSAEDNDYVLFPMENLVEKQKVLAMRAH